MKTRTRAKRRGFTLVELLVVIAIIGIIAAITIPTLYNAVLAARRTRITIELSELDKAVEQYKNDMGDYPPDFSSIRLTTLAAFQADLRDSGNVVVRHFRKAFPRHTEDLQLFFRNPRMDPNGAPSVPDRDEALVFWLSGLRKDPRKPLSGSGDLEVRIDFDKVRLVDPDNDGWMSYVPKDGSGAPYLYFESRTYDSSQYTFSGASVTETVRPYAFQAGDPTTTNNIGWAKADKFQIISAGLDAEFGDWQTPNPPATHGPHSPPAYTYKLFPHGMEKLNVTIGTDTFHFYQYSKTDRDNICNFSDKGKLEDHMP